MVKLHLKIITPKKIVLEKDVDELSLPTTEGEITVLPRHIHLFTLLEEGVVRIKNGDKEDYIAVGGGYLETDGNQAHVLVSRAYGQDEIDHKATVQAIEDAKLLMKRTKDKSQYNEVTSLLRKSLIDLKLLKKKAPKSFHNE
jgi:F-type H+-transporting ATPase subunit epsilon